VPAVLVADPAAAGRLSFQEMAEPEPGPGEAVVSVRARYWNEALKAWKDHPVVGVGAGGYATVRPFYRQDTLQVRHAHGYVVQTMADLGIVGLLISLALAVAWLMTAAGTVGLRRGDRGRPYPPERIGLLTLVTTVIVFAVHSFVDWTWFIPGNALPALLCAGWVAGRGPLGGNTASPCNLASRGLCIRTMAGLRPVWSARGPGQPAARPSAGRS